MPLININFLESTQPLTPRSPVLNVSARSLEVNLEPRAPGPTSSALLEPGATRLASCRIRSRPPSWRSPCLQVPLFFTHVGRFSQFQQPVNFQVISTQARAPAQAQRHTRGTRAKARRRHTPSFPTTLVPTIRGRCYLATMLTSTREAKTKSSWSHRAPQTSWRQCDGSRQGHHSSPQSLENPLSLDSLGLFELKRFKTGENLGKRAILTGSSQNLISTGHLFKVTSQSVDNMIHVFCSRYDSKH